MSNVVVVGYCGACYNHCDMQVCIPEMTKRLEGGLWGFRLLSYKLFLP